MSICRIWGLAAMAALAASLCVSGPAQAGEIAKPNVLFIVIDDLRTELGCYGAEQVDSPNIDALARRGVRFDRACCQYPICNPSRVSFLTGLRPETTRIFDNRTHFRGRLSEVVTLPQCFRAQGYFTASLGKVFHRVLRGDKGRPETSDPRSWNECLFFQATPEGQRGEGRNLTGGKLRWCHWRAAEGGDEDQADGQIAARGIRLLEENRDRPFFIALGFHKPHDPFIAPRKYFDRYPPEKLKLHDPLSDLTGDPEPAIPAGWRDIFAEFTDQERMEFFRAYLACISFTDAQIGKVLAALDRLKLTDSTVIVLVGDHGYHLGERGWWNKNTVFELSARAPMIVVAPQSQARGASCGRVVEFLDIYPTLTDLCGLKTPKHVEGTSLRPLLDDPQAAWDRPGYTVVQRGPIFGRSVRTARWRYVSWDEGRQGEQLYDHRSDPQEKSNLASDPRYAATVAQMKRHLEAMPRPVPPPLREAKPMRKPKGSRPRGGGRE